VAYYQFNQMPSGGKYEVNDSVAHCVVVEASSAEAANEIAQSIGLYFDGIKSGRDCSCCTDRWVRSIEAEATDVVCIGNKTLREFLDSPTKNPWFTDKKFTIHIYDSSGTKETHET